MVTIKKGTRELRVPESALQTYLNDGYSIAEQPPTTVTSVATKKPAVRAKTRRKTKKSNYEFDWPDD